jgi:hypothetical protein
VQPSAHVFKPSVFLRATGWALLLTFSGCALALLVHVVRNYAQMPADELWAALGIGVFVLLIALLGAGVQRSGFALGADYVEVRRPYGSRRFAITDLAGYGTLIIVVNLVPTFHVRLYRKGPVEIVKIPVSFGDRAEIERWFAQRLPVVDDPGSILRPQPRLRDAGGNSG